MKKLLLILPIVLLVSACSTPKTVLVNSQGQVAVCGGEIPTGIGMYWLQREIVDKECVQTYKDNGFKEKGEKDSELLTQKYKGE